MELATSTNRIKAVTTAQFLNLKVKIEEMIIVDLINILSLKVRTVARDLYTQNQLKKYKIKLEMTI